MSHITLLLRTQVGKPLCIAASQQVFLWQIKENVILQVGLGNWCVSLWSQMPTRGTLGFWTLTGFFSMGAEHPRSNLPPPAPLPISGHSIPSNAGAGDLCGKHLPWSRRRLPSGCSTLFGGQFPPLALEVAAASSRCFQGQAAMTEDAATSTSGVGLDQHLGCVATGTHNVIIKSAPPDPKILIIAVQLEWTIFIVVPGSSFKRKDAKIQHCLQLIQDTK